MKLVGHEIQINKIQFSHVEHKVSQIEFVYEIFNLKLKFILALSLFFSTGRSKTLILIKLRVAVKLIKALLVKDAQRVEQLNMANFLK